jgi:hypothetical protein
LRALARARGAEVALLLPVASIRAGRAHVEAQVEWEALRDEHGEMQDLDALREDPVGHFLTTDQGLRINDDQNSRKVGERRRLTAGDFILREKITHFDHERIPERVVHARVPRRTLIGASS